MWRRLLGLVVALTLAATPASSQIFSPQFLFQSASGTPGCSQSTAFYAQLATQPTTARKSLYNALICGLVTDGVFSKLDALYIFAAFDGPTALTNLVQVTYGGTSVNSATFTQDRGYTGNSSNMEVSTSFNPSTAIAANFVQNSATLFGWCLSTAEDAGDLMGGQTDNHNTIDARYTDGNYYASVNSGVSAASSGTRTTAAGLISEDRTGSTLETAYINGVAGGTDTVASILGTSTIEMLHGSADGFSSYQIGAAGIGASLGSSGQTALYNRLHTYLQAVAGVP